MKLYSLIGYFFVGSIATPALNEPISNELANQIDTYLLSVQEQGRIPGLTFSLTSGNETYTKGYGFRNLDKQLVADEDTLFAIGSVTKNMASLLISWELSKLFPEMGEKVLDTPILQLAPSYPLVLRDKFRTEQVTFRDLLSHRVCTHRNDFPWVIGVFDNITDMLYRERYAGELCGFRDGVNLSLGLKYNNRMYALAWDVLESLTNKTFEEATGQLFSLVGMTRSTIIKADDSDDLDQLNRALPHAYFATNDSIHAASSDKMKTVIPLAAAGAVLSTAKDMLVFLQFQLNKGKVNGTQIIPEQVFLWPRTPSHILNTGSLKSETVNLPWIQYAYGLGLRSEDYDGWLRIGHSGSIGSFSSYMYVYPEMQLGVFCGINGQGRQVDLIEVQNKIYEIVQGREALASSNDPTIFPEMVDFNPFFKAKKPSNTKPIQIAYNISDELLPGNYGNALFGVLKILKVTSGDGVVFQLEWGKYGRAILERKSSNSFHLIDTELYYGSPLMQSLELHFLNESHIDMVDLDTGDSVDILERDFDLSNLPENPWKETAPEACPSAASTVKFALNFMAVFMAVFLLGY